MVVESVFSSIAIVTEAEWHAVKSLKGEAAMLFHNLADNSQTKTVSPITSAVALDGRPERDSAANPTTTFPTATENQESGILTRLFSKLKLIRRNAPSITQFTLPERLPQPSDIPEVMCLFEEAIKEPNFLK